MDGGKIKLEAEAIGELVVDDTDWESGAEASDVADEFEEEEEEDEEEEEEEDNNNSSNSSSSNSKPQQKSNHILQQVADYQPGNHLKE